LKVERRLIGLVILVMASGVAVVLAASNMITLNHTAAIGPGATLGVTDIGASPPSTCPTTSASYGPGPVNIAWGTIGQGATVKHYLCVINTGSAPDTITVSGSPPSGYGSITSPQANTVLASGSTLAIELDWTIPSNAPLGPVGSFATTIT
jgi:hypothetical protein